MLRRDEHERFAIRIGGFPPTFVSDVIPPTLKRSLGPRGQQLDEPPLWVPVGQRSVLGCEHVSVEEVDRDDRRRAPLGVR
ncbi:hypothetical protein BH20ACT23_BH20ACT23_27430 [soil metagenome]